ncbi:hypothetical protein D3C72_777910 [compost metagenome]
MVEALRVTDSYQPFTDFSIIRASKWNGREVAAFNLENSQIQIIACAKHFSLIWLIRALNRHLYNIRIMNHVLIGQNVACFIKNKTGAKSCRYELVTL